MIITQTPLRISFAGGGTDFPDYYRKRPGAVLSSTIDKYVYVTVKRRVDDLIVAHYRETEFAESVSHIKHGLIREALMVTDITGGIEIATTADIPFTGFGSGLGSSSSMAVGILHALHAYKGELPTKEQLAKEACNIELDLLGNPIGKQDQYVAAFGGLNLIRFAKLGITVKPVSLNDETRKILDESLCLFHTGITKDSSQILAEQTRNIPERMEILDGIRTYVESIRVSLQEGDLERIGILLNENWKLKKKMASFITNSTIDRLYARAMKIAFGGKICGSGGGGYLLACLDPERKNEMREAMSGLKELPFRLTRYGTRVIFNQME